MINPNYINTFNKCGSEECKNYYQNLSIKLQLKVDVRRNLLFRVLLPNINKFLELYDELNVLFTVYRGLI